MSHHFGYFPAQDEAEDDLNKCIAADDCLRIAYAGPERVSGDVARVGADGRTVALAGTSAMQDAMRGAASQVALWVDGAMRSVNDIKVGDRLPVEGGGTSPVLAVRSVSLGWRTLGVNVFLRPIAIRESALGPGFPAQDILVAPGQLVCLPDAGGTCVPAHALLGRPGVARVATLAVTYIDITLADGPLALCHAALSGDNAAPATPAMFAGATAA